MKKLPEYAGIDTNTGTNEKLEVRQMSDAESRSFLSLTLREMDLGADAPPPQEILNALKHNQGRLDMKLYLQQLRVVLVLFALTCCGLIFMAAAFATGVAAAFFFITYALTAH